MGLSEVPVAKCIDTLPDAFTVDVILTDQTLSSFDHSFDPVQVQLHGCGEILVFLDGSLDCFYSSGQLHVSQCGLLKGEHGKQRNCFLVQKLSENNFNEKMS